MSDIMPTTIMVAKNRLFVKKYVTEKHHIKRVNLHSMSLLGVFQGPQIYFIIRVIILSVQEYILIIGSFNFD